MKSSVASSNNRPNTDERYSRTELTAATLNKVQSLYISLQPMYTPNMVTHVVKHHHMRLMLTFVVARAFLQVLQHQQVAQQVSQAYDMSLTSQSGCCHFTARPHCLQCRALYQPRQFRPSVTHWYCNQIQIGSCGLQCEVAKHSNFLIPTMVGAATSLFT